MKLPRAHLPPPPAACPDPAACRRRARSGRGGTRRPESFRRRTTNHGDDVVGLLEQQLGQDRGVLAGHTCHLSARAAGGAQQAHGAVMLGCAMRNASASASAPSAYLSRRSARSPRTHKESQFELAVDTARQDPARVRRPPATLRPSARPIRSRSSASRRLDGACRTRRTRPSVYTTFEVSHRPSLRSTVINAGASLSIQPATAAR